MINSMIMYSINTGAVTRCVTNEQPFHMELDSDNLFMISLVAIATLITVRIRSTCCLRPHRLAQVPLSSPSPSSISVSALSISGVCIR